MIERASGDIASAGEAKQQYDLLCGPPDKISSVAQTVMWRWRLSETIIA
jgi:hypothetical protein